MMRSNSIAKMAKPPPPIPPRPSKALVAEALAKSRNSPIINRTNENVQFEPAKNPPPTPCKNNPVVKSQSYSNVFFGQKEKDVTSRPVVFQSANIKTSKVEVKLTRHESDRLCCRNDVWKNNCVNVTNEVKSDDKQSELIIENDSHHSSNKDPQWNEVLIGKNHVNTLIDEMFASILDSSDEKSDLSETSNETISVSSVEKSDFDSYRDHSPKLCEEELENTTTVLIIDDKNDSQNCNSNTSTEKRVKFDDKKNHELLISELENMRMEQNRILKRQRKPSEELYDEDLSKIQHSDWVEVNNGQEVRLSSCQIIIEDDDCKKSNLADPIVSRSNMSLHGLPPLPKSLSGFNLLDNQRTPQTPTRALITPPISNFGSGHRSFNGTPDSGSGRTVTNLDNQLAILRREMYGLRQLDLSLLSQLWSLNESIQDFRQILQDQDERALSPPSPSPSPSSCDDGEADEFFSPSPIRLRPAPPPPPLRRSSNPSNSSSANSSEYGTV